MYIFRTDHLQESFPFQSYAFKIVESHCIVHDFILTLSRAMSYE